VSPQVGNSGAPSLTTKAFHIARRATVRFLEARCGDCRRRQRGAGVGGATSRLLQIGDNFESQRKIARRRNDHCSPFRKSKFENYQKRRATEIKATNL